MAKGDIYVKRTEEFLLRIQDKKEFEVVDVEFVKENNEYYLRVFADMDKEGGISIDDCVEISKMLNEWLDKEDFISETYTLEVSSPGLGRTLKKEKDFIRENGKEVEVKLYKPVDGSKEYSGFLRNFDEHNITIEVEGVEKIFARKDISLIRLALDF